MKPSSSAHMFYTDTKFDRTVRSPGGVPRDEAVARADAEIEALRANFETWVDMALSEIVRITRSLPKDSADMPAIEALHRNSAYLLDVGTTMGFALITFVAKNFCEVLEAMQNGATFRKALIECHVGALQLARQDRYRGLRLDQVADMTDGLRQLLRLTVETRA